VKQSAPQQQRQRSLEAHVTDIEPAAVASAWQRQIALCGIVVLALIAVVGGLYLQDRSSEWGLREEQAQHRLDMVSELLVRELARVRSDALYLADQRTVRQFVAGTEERRSEVEKDFVSFMNRKATYDQIRLLSMDGDETLRVNYHGGDARAVDQAELQDKEDRYYYREALGLEPNEVFVSDLDLNLEHGQIERPFKPVIRFVTPVAGRQDSDRSLLVLNYLGAELLSELDDLSLPGKTLLLRSDGHYVRGPAEQDAWGWILGHQRTFARQFPEPWQRLPETTAGCRLTKDGAFASRIISLGRDGGSTGRGQVNTSTMPQRDALIIVSYLPADEVFASSRQLLQRLLILAACMSLPLVILVRHWAHSSLNRTWQAQQIALSESRLRELSSRLLRIQEDERRAISREIHDELGQQVTAISLDLKLAARNLAVGKAEQHLERAIHENEQLLQTLHAFATRVRPAVLDDLGLAEALQSQLWDFEKRTGIQVHATIELPDEPIAQVIADNVYRLLQESLNNVVKHAEAKNVSVEITSEPLDSKSPAAQHGGSAKLRFRVTDDGRGLAGSLGSEKRLGIVGMRERVDLLGGSFNMETCEPAGTRVQIELPLLVTSQRDAPAMEDAALLAESISVVERQA
jgi:signal transduction histidine kinase